MWPPWRPKPFTSSTVMPCTPIAFNASFTSSTLCGLMTAVTRLTISPPSSEPKLSRDIESGRRRRCRSHVRNHSGSRCLHDSTEARFHRGVRTVTRVRQSSDRNLTSAPGGVALDSAVLGSVRLRFSEKLNGKDGATTRRIRTGHFAAMGANNLINNRKPKP